MGKQHTVSDGNLMLVLEEAEEGGFVVTSPIDPGLVTQAETVQEAFVVAHEARELLIQGRAELARKMLGTRAVRVRNRAEEHDVAPASSERTSAPSKPSSIVVPDSTSPTALAGPRARPLWLEEPEPDTMTNED